MATTGDSELYAALLPELASLERERKVIAMLLRLGILVLALPVVLTPWIWLQLSGDFAHLLQFSPLFLAIYGSICIGIGYFSRTRLTRPLARHFKQKVVRRLFSHIDKGLRYCPQGSILADACRQSKLVIQPYYGDDLVTGTINGASIRFSELHGAMLGMDDSPFKGLFFELKFNKKFKGELLVLPEVVAKTLRQLGQLLVSAVVSSNEQRIMLEDPEFERHFEVYGTDQIEARYILSHSLMRRLVDFRIKAGRDVRLSFVNGRVYVAVSYGRELFEPTLFKPLMNEAKIGEYLADIRFAVGIVDDLNLNLTIWKQDEGESRPVARSRQDKPEGLQK